MALLPFMGLTQNYTSYFTGNTNDLVSNALGGICLMGGASEDDQAILWFLEKANGGDVLVLRATGSDGYNDYFFSSIGANINSVETIVCHNAEASNEAYIIQKINQAEAIWFAGGDQWDYISFWRNTPVSEAINEAIQERNIAIGGTSAGMAIMGDYYFSAQNNTVSSNEALSNPFSPNVTVDATSFLENDILANTITDTHFDNPDRKGRLTTFLARIAVDFGVFGKAIACDEYTAVCIEPNGIAHVFGGFPQYDDNAYFIQTNCELTNQAPENCTENSPLTWDLSGQALKVYKVKGNFEGSNTFDLNDWETGSGGTWMHWSVDNGLFNETEGSPVICSALSNDLFDENAISVYPNPAQDFLTISTNGTSFDGYEVSVYNMLGQACNVVKSSFTNYKIEIDLTSLSNGTYFLIFSNQNEMNQFKISVMKN